MNARGAIRVADFSDLSGAFCGRILAGLGAEVRRFSRPDSWRSSTPAAGIFYDFGTVASVEVRDRAAQLDGADIVLTTGRPSDLGERGLDYASLAAIDPRLIVVNISPFGLEGPRADWLSTNLVAAACGGMLYVNGWPESAPLQPLGLQAYHVAGIQGALGALLALRHREDGGAGQLVDISLQESVIASVEHVTGLFRESDQVARRTGTLHWTRTFRTVRCRDGEILATHLGDWDALRAWIEAESRESGLSDECLETPDDRRAHAEALFDRIETWSVRHGAAELVEKAQLVRVPFAPVSDLGAAVTDPQLAARGFFAEVAVGAAKYVAPRRPLPLPSLDGALSGPECRVVGRSARSAQTSRPGALSGVRVLDLTWVVAGPSATRILCDHGAEVIKIEHPATATPGPRRGGLFGNLNRGKKSVVLDLATDRGLDRLRQLIESSDVLVENFSPRVMANWGLDDDALRALQPGLVVIHMSGFGRGGPRENWVSYGPTLQSMLGYTSTMRHPGGRSAGWGYSFSDMASGQVAALAVVAALRSGRGCTVDLSQHEVLASLVGPELIEAASGGEVALAIGNAAQEGRLSPHGVYRCRDTVEDPCDRWIALAVAEDEQWKALVEVAGLSFRRSAELHKAEGRAARSTEVDRAIEAWTRRKSAESVASTLQEAGVPAAVVYSARDLRTDEHLQARGMWVRLSTPDAGEVELDASPIRLSATPARVSMAGPLLDEHGREVLRGVGHTDGASPERSRP